jgi:ABC-type multidrug transport system fused ATPase/permease subunit
MLLAALLSWVLSWAKTYVMATISERISADLRNATYAHLQRLSLEFFGGKRTGDLISRVSDDTQRICDFLSIHAVDFATDIIMIIITAILLIWLDPTMALVGLLPFPFIAWIVARVQARMRAGFARGSSAWAELVNVLADTIPGIRVVKAFAQENREVDRFQQRNDHVLHANDRVNRLWAAFAPIITLLTDIGLLIIYGFGDYRADGMIQIWDPPRFLHHVTFTLVLLAFIMLAATYAPMSYLKQGLKHPMLAAVKTWALGHLLSNGDLGGMILFGAFLAYGVIDRISVKRRAADPDAPAPKPPRIIGDIIAVGAGSFAYLAMMMLHTRLIGVSVMP